MISSIKTKPYESVKYLKKFYDASLKQSARSSMKTVEAMGNNEISESGPQAIVDILKNCLSQVSVYKNSLKNQRYERLENKIDQLSKQVEQIRGFVITFARRLNNNCEPAILKIHFMCTIFFCFFLTQFYAYELIPQMQYLWY